MFPFLLILGVATIIIGIYSKQMLQSLGYKPSSEIITTHNLKHSTRTVEQLGRWLLIILGVSFFIQGLGGTLPSNIGSKISVVLLGLCGLMFLAIIGTVIVNWKAR